MKYWIAALLVGLWIAPPVLAKNSSHCGVGEIVSVGDSMRTIRKKCGEPFEVETVSVRTGKKRRYYSDGTWSSVEYWIAVVDWYICIESYVVRFTFEGNTCTDMESLVEPCY